MFFRKPAFPTVLQTRKIDPSPPTRLSQLNYAMMKETALRKKLQEIGIPNWGSKDLMKRRHIEWLNIYNSNCDSDASVRKTHRQLLRELDEWEQTQGGRANNRESKIMKKDFDGEGYAKSHKTEFEDLIARARQKRATPKLDSEEPSGQNTPVEQQPLEPRGEDTVNGTGVSGESLPNHVPSDLHQPVLGTPNLYENESATSSIQAEAKLANGASTISTLELGNSIESSQKSLQSPSRKAPIIALPEEPVRDMEGGATVQ